jgi:hypothetical protein
MPAPQVAQPQDGPLRRAIAARLGRRCVGLARRGIDGGISSGNLAGRTAVTGCGQKRRAASAATPPAWPLSGFAGHG